MSLSDLALLIHSYDKQIPEMVNVLSAEHHYERDFNLLEMDVYTYDRINPTVEYSVVHHPQYKQIFDLQLFRKNGMSMCIIPDIENIHPINYSLFEPVHVHGTNVYAVVPHEWFLAQNMNVSQSIMVNFRMVK